MGDCIATIDMGQKVGGCCALSMGAQQLPTFQPMSIVYVYVGFWTDHSHTETRVDENQLVRVEDNNFMTVVRLCLIPITGFFMGRKLGGGAAGCAPFQKRAESPSNTM